MPEINTASEETPLPPCYVYVLLCCDGSLYTGWTNRLEQRVQTHNAGKGGKYTRSRLPVELACAWAFDSQSEAMRWEKTFKQYPRPQKRSLLHQAPILMPSVLDKIR